MSEIIIETKRRNTAENKYKKMLIGSTILAAFTFGLTGAAIAQDVEQDGDGETVEETLESTEPELVSIEFDEYPIVATGTRIRNSVSALNSDVFDAEDIRLSGALTLDDFLRQIPQNQTRLDPGVADFGGTGAAGGAGTFSDRSGGVNLRGLGEQNTLILVNGRRIAAASSRPRDGSGSGGLRAVGATADIEAIPLQAIERIEIITDGASAIYGSDAIGGVVNIIMKTDYEGGSVTARYGNSSSGADDFSLLGTYGYNKGAFRSLVTAGYSREKSVRVGRASFVRSNEDFEAQGLFPVPGSLSGFPAIAQIGTSICDDGMGGEEQCDPEDPFSFFDEIRFGSLNIPTDQSQVVFANFPEGLGRFPTVDDVQLGTVRNEALLPQVLGPDSEALSFSGDFGYVVSPETELRASFLYSRRESKGAFTPFTFDYRLDQTHPFNPFTIANGAQFDEGIQALFSGAALAQEGLLPFQEFSDTNDNYTFGLGVDQKLGFNNWELRADYTYSGSKGSGQSLTKDTAAELAFLSSPEFETLDVFGPDGPNPELLRNIIIESPRRSKNQLHALTVAADGEVFKLPGGAISLAIGGEYRNEAFNFVNQERLDPNTGEFNTPFCLSSAFACELADTNADFNRDIYGAFAETSIPLVGQDMNVPLMDEFILSVSTRYDRYEDEKVRDRFSSAVGGVWRVNDTLSFRGNWNESFRAPDIIQLSNPVITIENGFSFTDPLNPFGLTRILTQVTGGNVDLKDEVAESFSAGGRVNFDVGETSVVFNVNYFDNEIRDQSTGNFSRETRQAILGNPELFPDIIQRDITTPNIIESLIEVPFNAVSTKSEGMDFSARIAHELNNGHTVAAIFNGTKNFKFKTQQLEIIEAVDLVGRDQGPLDFSGNAELRYITDNLTAGVTARYSSSYKYGAFNRNEFEFTDFTVGDYLTFDLQASYDFGERDGLLNGTRIGLTGTNIFETRPDLYGASPYGVGYFAGVDPRQRVFAVEATRRF